MSEQLKESISAVMDGEADEFELRRVLDEVGRTPALKQSWETYHMIGAQLRGEQQADALLPVGALQQLADNVWETLGAEAAQSSDPDGAWQVPVQGLTSQSPTLVAAEPAAAGTSGGLSARTGLAVAASVALMVMVGFFSFQEPQTTQDVAQDTLAIEGPVFQVSTQASPMDIQRANAYMLHHVQQTALNKAGVASFSKVVIFEKEK